MNAVQNTLYCNLCRVDLQDFWSMQPVGKF
jgi:hypothetical protein